MIKRILFFIVIIAGIASAAYLVTAARRHPAPQPPRSQSLSGPYAAIKLGMTESQVAALVGLPASKSRYGKYEKKSGEYWAALQKQVDAGSDAPVYGSTPPLALIKARAELTHRYKDVWMYKPAPNTMMTLYFGDDGILLNTGMSGSRSMPGSSMSGAYAQ